MKWTIGRLNDKETLLYFLPARPSCDVSKIMDKDWEAYFDFSERGKKPIEVTEGYVVINLGKMWRDQFVGIYEQGILRGAIGWWTIFGGDDGDKLTPRSVVDFLKKNMFQGIDSEAMEKCYQDVIIKKQIEQTFLYKFLDTTGHFISKWKIGRNFYFKYLLWLQVRLY